MKRPLRISLWVLFLLYCGILLRITVFRSSFGSYPLFSHGQIAWVPFVGLIQILHNSLRVFLYLFIGNLIWFVPFGLLLPLLTKAKTSTIFYGFLLSVYIEVSQYIFGTGVSEVEDLILNTMGTAMGYSLFLLLRRISRRRKSSA